jgi:beta-glucosidase
MGVRAARKRAIVLAAAFAGVVAAPASGATCTDPAFSSQPWCDASRPAEERAAAMVAAMTSRERALLLAGRPVDDTFRASTLPVARVGLPAAKAVDGPVGVRQGVATALPTGLALAATFDAGHAAAYGRVIGEEVRAKGNFISLGPTVNILRDPRGGRSFEGFGEDPWLASHIAVSWIRGLRAAKTLATVKHYAANNQEGLGPGSPDWFIGLGGQGNRYVQNSVVDDRTLREIYLPAFEAAVREGGAEAVMCAYNRVNGPKACASRTLIGDILRGEWGFRGLVMSDWILATLGVSPGDLLRAGMDLEMPFPASYSPDVLQLLVRLRLVRQAHIDERARTIVATLIRGGLLDDPPPAGDAGVDARTAAAHAAVAEDVAADAAVLLRNDGVLPLDRADTRTIALVGRGATEFVTGGGSSKVRPTRSVTLAQGIAAEAPGAALRVVPRADIDAAVAAARDADVAIVAVRDWESEGADRPCLTLAPNCAGPYGDQDVLVRAVAAVQPRTVVVSQTGAPVLMPWRDDVAAILQGWYGGQANGAALAAILFGERDPGGRLPATFPASAADLPTAGDPARYPGTAGQNVFYREGVLVGYRWFDARGLEPAFPFGYGRSYTSFAYDDLTAERADGAGEVTVTARVTNTGGRAGTDVAQLYVGLPSRPGAEQPPSQLRGAERVRLAPGASARVRFTLDARALSTWDASAGTWARPAGCVELKVGRSSRDLPLRATLPGSCP